MKKILFVESTLFKSGPNNQLGYIIDNLKEYSYKILTFSNGDQLKGKNLFYLKIPQGIRGIFYLKYIKNFIESCDHDLIHINSSFRVLLFLNFLIKDKSKVLFVLRNDPSKVWGDKYPFFLSSILSKIYMIILKKINIVFCSKSLFEKYKTNFSQKKNCIIQNSVNIIKNTSERKINTSKIKFLILSRLLKTKNIPFLIKTFKNDNFFSRHQLYIAGDGNQKNKIIKMCQGARNIFVKGHVHDVRKIFDETDILLSSSTTEGLPNSVLEALSNNIPCILSDIDQHNEIYESVDSLKNLIFKNNESIELIKCVKYLIDNENEVRANMKKVIKNFSVEKMVTSYEDFYNKLCSNQNY